MHALVAHFIRIIGCMYWVWQVTWWTCRLKSDFTHFLLHARIILIDSLFVIHTLTGQSVAFDSTLLQQVKGEDIHISEA